MNRKTALIFLSLIVLLSLKSSEGEEAKIELPFQVSEGNRIIGNIYNGILRLKEKYAELGGFDKEALKWNYSSNALKLEGSGLKDSKLDISSIYYAARGAYIDIFYSLNSFSKSETKDRHVTQYLPKEIYIPRLKLYLEHYTSGNQQMEKELSAIIKQNIDLSNPPKTKIQNKTKDVPQGLIRSQDFLSGYTLLLSGDSRKSVSYLVNATKLNPMDAEAFGLLGDAYSSLGEYDMAEENYHKARVLYNKQANSYMAQATLRNLKKLKLKKEAQGWPERKIQDIVMNLPSYFTEEEVLGGKVFRDSGNRANTIVVIIDNKPLEKDLKDSVYSKYAFWDKTYYPGIDPIPVLWNKSYKSHFLEIQKMENINFTDFHGFITKGIRKTSKGDLVYMLDYLLFKKDDDETKINVVIQSPQGYFLNDLTCDYIVSTVRKSLN